MDAESRRKVLGMLIGLSMREGKMSQAEVAFIDRTAAALGICMDEGCRTMPIADPKLAVATLRDMPAEVQREVLRVLIEAAAVDGVVHDDERRFLLTAAEAVGWTASDLEDRIVELLSGIQVG
jgi:uncharacterized tellurite resistance protein B-like protein